MGEEIRVPKMGESISGAVVGILLKESGAVVHVDDEIIELETDKVNQVLYAPASGRLSWQVKPGDTVTIGQLLGTVENEKGEKPVKGKTPPNKSATKTPSPPAKKEPTEPSPMPPVPPPRHSSETSRYGTEAFLAEITQKAPAEQQQESPKQEPPKQKPSSDERPPPPQAPKPPTIAVASAIPSTGERESRKRMSQIRQVIAQRLVEGQQQAAVLTTFNEVDMTAVMDLRTRYKEVFTKRYSIRLGLLPFFVKATVAALQAFPLFNSYIDGTDIVERHYYDIGIAVGTDRGLVVPVVRGCDTLSFAAIEKQLEDYSGKARTGRLDVRDLQGGGFTITNGGVYGSLFATPLLNPPQCGILGMQKILKRPVVVDDQIVIRPMMYLALSYDHRLIDGREAVLFLVHIKNSLEDPSRLLLEL